MNLENLVGLTHKKLVVSGELITPPSEPVQRVRRYKRYKHE